jgi:hypothetical protein
LATLAVGCQTFVVGASRAYAPRTENEQATGNNTMRIIGLMTFVCLLLMLAMVPAWIQMARAFGLHPSGTMSLAIALLLVAGMFSRRA